MTVITNIPLSEHALSRHRSVTERHVNDLLEALEELLGVPELLCLEPDEIFDYTLGIMAKARVIRAAVIDEFADLDGAS